MDQQIGGGTTLLACSPFRIRGVQRVLGPGPGRAYDCVWYEMGCPTPNPNLNCWRAELANCAATNPVVRTRAGGFSLVHRAMYKGTPVAVKQWFNPDLTEAVLQEFRQEVRER